MYVLVWARRRVEVIAQLDDLKQVELADGDWVDVFDVPPRLGPGRRLGAVHAGEDMTQVLRRLWFVKNGGGDEGVRE